MKKKPELMPIKANLEEYDTIIIGSPIWAGCFAPAIRTLLETGILKDKNIAFFYTSMGGPANAKNNIKESVEIDNRLLIPIHGIANVKDDFEGVKSMIVSWIENIREQQEKGGNDMIEKVFKYSTGDEKAI